MPAKTFGHLSSGEEIIEYTLSSNDMIVRFLNWGGIIKSIQVPNRDGIATEVTLGFDSLEPYIKGTPFFGALVGRYGNRIKNGQFELDGVQYQLPINNLGNHLHGGVGFDKKIWSVEAQDSKAILTYLSKDGEEGYQGNVDVKVVYELVDHALHIEYEAETDAPTIINLTNHSYFNLDGNGDILDHELKLYMDHYLPVDETFIPLHSAPQTASGPFDFSDWKKIGEEIGSSHEQIQRAGGYDHCYSREVITTQPELVAEARSSESGIAMQVLTTEPGVQFFSGNYSSVIESDGKRFPPRSGFCLETQHFPDSPNRPDFPSTVLRPGEIYKSETIYRFSIH